MIFNEMIPMFSNPFMFLPFAAFCCLVFLFIPIMYVCMRQPAKTKKKQACGVSVSDYQDQGAKGLLFLKGGEKAKVHQLGTEYQKGVYGWTGGWMNRYME